MENQHRKITGYRELSQVEIDLINEIKAEGERLQALCSRVSEHISDQYQKAWEDEVELARLGQALPGAWSSEAIMDFKRGLMSLTRAVAQPTNF